MISRSLYYQVIIRVLAIVLVALAAGTVVALGGTTFLTVILVLAEIPLIVSLVKFLNVTNRKISYFFDSVQNNDSALKFETGLTNKPIRDLYQGLNKVNEQIQQLKIESRQHEQYFQTLIEHVATGILTFNPKGFVLHANSASRKMFGVEVLTHINQLERVNQSLFLAVRDIRPFEQKRVSIVSERGTVELSIKATSFKTRAEELLLVSVQDIRNELDENELDSWMKLIRVLMHEIMNSIAPITSLSESLSKLYSVDGRDVEPAEIDEKVIRNTVLGLNVIGEQGNGLIKFVESYRKLTRLPKPDRKIFRAEALINRIKVLYSSFENNEKAKLSVTVTPENLELFADEDLVAQVLLNLVKNALEAIPVEGSGAIWIKVKAGANNRSEISVTDNGPGIPREILEQIFVPFFTTKESGSGIGLSLSRQIMRLHDGSLQVRSNPGKETVFTMTL